MSKTIELPDELYKHLEEAAAERGLTPADWIAASLPETADSTEEQGLADLLHGVIGSIDSTSEPRGGHPSTPISELIARKLERQGLRRP